MSDIVHRIGVRAPAATALEAFTTLKGLASWWTTHLEGNPLPGGALTFRFPNTGPSFDVLTSEHPNRVLWRCTGGPDDWIGTSIAIQLVEQGNETAIVFTHADWREQTELMHHCSTQWAYFLIGLKQHLEGGAGYAFGSSTYREISDWSPPRR
ncbi:MAG: SRPBCC domain-containing protein [Hyphomonadaceae bacterium]